jgi:hypothetical protein
MPVDKFVEAGNRVCDIIYKCFFLDTAAACVVFRLYSGV